MISNSKKLLIPGTGALASCGLLVALLLTAAAAQAQLSLDDLLQPAGDEPEFLDPDVAFIVEVEATATGDIATQWTVAEGYYLYRDKIKFSSDEKVALGSAALPEGKVKDDPYFGPLATLAGVFEVAVPVLQRSAASHAVTIAYQGCAEDGICYPPIEKTFMVSFSGSAPAGSGGVAPSLSEPVPASSADGLAARLAQRGGWLTLLSFFGFGLLLAFTPCVLPMVPILSGIIVGEGETSSARRALMLSTSYVLAMAFAYAAAGVAAGYFGQNLQAAMQHPAVLTGFAVLFVALAMSMFGFYELQVPAALQTRLSAVSNEQRRGSIVGAAVMGALSAVIVGPCVAPPLAGALLYIGQTGDALLGGAALFALAMGMGLPLVLVGVSAGHLLPRAGIWMESVKRVFGVLMLAVAVWMLERILPATLVLGLWALLLIVSAVYLGAFDRVEPGAAWMRLRKGTGLVMLTWGVAMLVGVAGGASDPLQPLAGFGTRGEPRAAVEEELFVKVKGPDGLAAALVDASSRQRPVVLDFYADWCVECKQLERNTFTDPGVIAALRNVAPLQADVTANDPSDRALLEQMQLFGPPAILFFDASGRERRDLRVIGYVDAEEFSQRLERVAPALLGDAR